MVFTKNHGIYIKKILQSKTKYNNIKKILLQSKKYSRTGEGRKEGTKEMYLLFVQMYVMLQPAPTPQRSGLWSSIPPLGGGGVTRGISSAQEVYDIGDIGSLWVVYYIQNFEIVYGL